jgi:hypothetical protein
MSCKSTIPALDYCDVASKIGKGAHRERPDWGLPN